MFWIFGVPGAALAVLIRLTVRESMRETRVVEEDGSLWSAIQRISALPGFPAIALAVDMTAVSGYGLGVWSPSFMIRVLGLSLVDAGLYLGLIGVFGGLGDVSIRYALLSSLIFCAAGAFAFSCAKDPYAQAVNAAARSLT